MRTDKLIIVFSVCFFLCLAGCREKSEHGSAPSRLIGQGLKTEALSQGEGNWSPGDIIGVMEGQIAPDFTLTSLDGREYKLSSYLGKNPVYLLFWATWCPYCIREIPKIKEIHQKFSPKGLKILAIDIAVNDPLERVYAFQKKYDLHYPILYDKTNAISRQYQIIGVPVSIVIDIQGKIRYRANVAPDDLERYVKID